MKDDHQDLAKLLRADASRIRETEDFDPKLHQDTMREIRCIESGVTRDKGFCWSPLKVSAVAAIAVFAFVLVLRQDQNPAESGIEQRQKIVSTPPPVSGSARAYREAFAESEEVLLAMLDRDALVVLPRSCAIFHSDR